MKRRARLRCLGIQFQGALFGFLTIVNLTVLVVLFTGFLLVVIYQEPREFLSFLKQAGFVWLVISALGLMFAYAGFWQASKKPSTIQDQRRLFWLTTPIMVGYHLPRWICWTLASFFRAQDQRQSVWLAVFIRVGYHFSKQIRWKSLANLPQVARRYK